MPSFMVTDLTKFHDENVCLAAIDMETGECVRPLPYFSYKVCRQNKIIPGSILNFQFKLVQKTPELPHCEDKQYDSWGFVRQGTANELQSVLENSAVSSLEAGFGVNIEDGEKSFKVDAAPQKSLITLKACAKGLALVQDDYKPGRVKLHAREASTGRGYRFLPINDLGYYDYSMACKANGTIDDFLKSTTTLALSQESIFLRVGIGRAWQERFWLQINGIYTFPHYDKRVRCYES